MNEVIDKRLNIEWINKEAHRLLKKHWGIDYIPTIVFDRTPKEEWDNYYPKEEKSILLGLYHNKDMTIEFNSEINRRRTIDQVRKTLLHELCHWYLHYNKLPHRDFDVRFGHELIRTGLKPNATPSHRKAYSDAKKDIRYRTFELIDNGEEKITTRLYHKRKNQDDFKKDLKDTLERLRIEFLKQVEACEKDEISYIEEVWVGDVAEKLCEWHGYDQIEYPVYSIIVGNDRGCFEDNDDFDSVIDTLEFEIEKC